MSLLGWHVHGTAQIRRGEVLGRETSSARRDLRPTEILLTDVGLWTPASSGKGKINVFGHFGRQETGIPGVRVGNASRSPVLSGIELFGTCHGNSPGRITAGRLIAVDLEASVICRGALQGRQTSRSGVSFGVGSYRIGPTAPSASLPATRVQFGLGAVLQHSRPQRFA